MAATWRAVSPSSFLAFGSAPLFISSSTTSAWPVEDHHWPLMLSSMSSSCQLHQGIHRRETNQRSQITAWKRSKTAMSFVAKMALKGAQLITSKPLTRQLLHLTAFTKSSVLKKKVIYLSVCYLPASAAQCRAVFPSLSISSASPFRLSSLLTPSRSPSVAYSETEVPPGYMTTFLEWHSLVIRA